MSKQTALGKDEEPESMSEKDEKERDFDEPSLNLSEIRELAELVNEYGFTDFRFENEKIKVRLSKQMYMPAAVSQAQIAQPATSTQSQATQSEASVEDIKSQPPADDLHVITSPIVGTFYRAPGPDKEPYVKEGSLVSPETVVCIVEAMKLMNEIQAETSGEVVKIYVENGQPVEYGQPLFGIKK
ncbi:acetyl-CoA carboxylase biotin carboxyl carrier protein [Leptolyngbya sp. 7M]|uniref:acetyl-CoA carboxylase biotin carboxyl carrier protein n=1 Tax=Leptolyngbya sp. 7M TaxID=2812896 RepID=UPI001B8C4243|nr:acetyl-CoA carboxylase biotin carboxyl carrier protein [Leptolyngbya sp. 7M]QYO66023.1 acetyl-CoA carboxylase biotin carboxyl carrier protein [Leptolyngbya sp. 7M]